LARRGFGWIQPVSEGFGQRAGFAAQWPTEPGDPRPPILGGKALSEWKAYKRRSGPDDPVFVTRTGKRQTVTNVDHRLKTAIKAANKRLSALGVEPISDRVSPHSLRRTYASLRAAAGDQPVYVAEQLGHEDPGFTFRVYQRAVKRRERLSGAYLEAFDGALCWAAMSTGEAVGGQQPQEPIIPGERSPHP
jgi:hypothetical protein